MLPSERLEWVEGWGMAVGGAGFVYRPRDAGGVAEAIEAASAAGVPIVAARAGGIPEAVRDGVNGLLVDYFDTDALAVQMAEVIDHPADFAHLGEAARQTILAGYERSDCLARHHTLIESVAYGLA